MIVTLKGEAEEIQPARAGIYVLSPKPVNGKSHWLTMYRNGNFGLVFGSGEILLTYMIFVYHWTSWVSRTPRKIKKRPTFFSKATDKTTATLIEIL